MKIRELFRQPIDRRIEEVIKVDLTDEERVADELSEYVVTDHLRQQFENVLDVFQETINKPGEAVTVWVSGFFGSGKSSFAKVLGYLLENPTVLGRTAAERFFERCADTRIRSLLATIHAQAPSLSVFVDLSTARFVLREGESIVLPLYRALLDRLGYSKDVLLADLEYALEGDGDLERFEKAFQEITGRSWKERRHVAFARNEASHAMSRIRPQTYPNPDSWVRGAWEPEVTADWFVNRALELLARRGGGKKRLVFVVDEVGQYVARSEDRMFDLMGLAHAAQKKRGAIWVVATSQEKLEDVVESLEGRRIELARVRERFPNTVDLVPSDIEEIVARRVLEKTAEGAKAVRQHFRAFRNRMTENTRLDSPTRQVDFSEESFVRLYPVLPYQIQLFIDAVSAHRGRGGASPMLGGSNRTLIKLAQQLIVHPKTKLGEREVGALVTADMAYDLLAGITPTAWQAELDRVAERHGPDSVVTRVAKAIALLGNVRALKLNTANLAALLHPAIESESLKAEVENGLKVLINEEVVREAEGSYRLQSPEEKSWERERRSIDMKPAQWHRLRRELLRQMLEGLAVEMGRTFRIGAVVDGQRLLEGDVDVFIEETKRSSFEEVRARSRERAQALFWAYEPQDETVDLARELHRSNEMIQRHEASSRSAHEMELLGEERVRRQQLEKRLRDRLQEDLLAGTLFFQGVDEEPQGGDARTALKQALEGKIETIYPRLHEFVSPTNRRDALDVLRADSLEGMPAYLEQLGAIRRTPDGPVIATDADPLATVLAEIRERASYGSEATGKYLEQKFGAPPYGAPVEVLQVLLALLLRAGAIEVIAQGARIPNPRDRRLEGVFSRLPAFRSAAFAPQREVDPDMRARVAKRLGTITGEREPIATDQLARRVREVFRNNSEQLVRVVMALKTLGLFIPEVIQRVDEFTRSLDTLTGEEIIKTCDEAWEDLKQGLEAARRWDEILDDETLSLLRKAQQTRQRGPLGLGPEEKERLEQLTDLMRGPDLLQNLGRVRQLVAEQEQAYQTAWEKTVQELRDQVNRAVAELRRRFAGTAEEATLEEALRPLAELSPPADASPDTGPPLEALQSGIATVPILLRKIEEELIQSTVASEVAHVRLRELYSGAITSEEELEALLERMRQAIQAHLAQGKQVVIE